MSTLSREMITLLKKSLFLLLLRGCSLLEVEGALSQRQNLTAEVSALGEEEQRLEQLIQRCSLDIRHMSELPGNQKYPFLVGFGSTHVCEDSFHF